MLWVQKIRKKNHTILGKCVFEFTVIKLILNEINFIKIIIIELILVKV